MSPSTKSYRIVQHDTARDFLSCAGPWLLKAEAEHNLILGIAGHIAETTGDDPANSLFTVESDGSVVGCAFRTPPYKLGLTRMPLKAIPVLVDAVGDRYETLPGVLGPKEEARYFSRIWCGPRALSFRPMMDQRIYTLEELVEPVHSAPGQLRTATEADRLLVVDWLGHFFEETRMPVSNAQVVADRLLPQGSMFFWVNEGIDVSMAGITARTPNGARIGFVYTLPDRRKNGFGSAITAELTRRMLSEGNRFCFLFTDTANPTSNRIYQALGYQATADVLDYQFF